MNLLGLEAIYVQIEAPLGKAGWEFDSMESALSSVKFGYLCNFKRLCICSHFSSIIHVWIRIGLLRSKKVTLVIAFGHTGLRAVENIFTWNKRWVLKNSIDGYLYMSCRVDILVLYNLYSLWLSIGLLSHLKIWYEFRSSMFVSSILNAFLLWLGLSNFSSMLLVYPISFSVFTHEILYENRWFIFVSINGAVVWPFEMHHNWLTMFSSFRWQWKCRRRTHKRHNLMYVPTRINFAFRLLFNCSMKWLLSWHILSVLVELDLHWTFRMWKVFRFHPSDAITQHSKIPFLKPFRCWISYSYFTSYFAFFEHEAITMFYRFRVDYFDLTWSAIATSD